MIALGSYLEKALPQSARCDDEVMVEMGVQTGLYGRADNEEIMTKKEDFDLSITLFYFKKQLKSLVLIQQGNDVYNTITCGQRH